MLRPHDCYLDLMHFDEEGNRRLAEAMFEAIEPVLEHDLAPSTNVPAPPQKSPIQAFGNLLHNGSSKDHAYYQPPPRQ